MERNVKCRYTVVLKIIGYRISNYSFVVFSMNLFRNTRAFSDLERFIHVHDGNDIERIPPLVKINKNICWFHN